MEAVSLNKEQYPEKVRFSIINVVNEVIVAGTGESFHIAHLGKPIVIDGKEYKRYQALGGAAKVTEEGRKHLERVYGAEFGRKDRSAEEADDARFYVPLEEDLRASEKERNQFISSILEEFNNKNDPFFELDISRELREDLVSEGVLTEEEFKQILSKHKGAVSPILWKTKTSEREKAEIPSFRTFHLHDITVSQELFNKLKASKHLHILTEDDIEAIHRAATEGKPAGISGDKAFVENILPEFVPAKRK